MAHIQIDPMGPLLPTVGSGLVQVWFGLVIRGLGTRDSERVAVRDKSSSVPLFLTCDHEIADPLPALSVVF